MSLNVDRSFAGPLDFSYAARTKVKFLLGQEWILGTVDRSRTFLLRKLAYQNETIYFRPLKWF